MSDQPRLMKRFPHSDAPPQGITWQGYVSLQEAARWASISGKTIRRWISRGLPVYQAGPRTKVLVRLQDIERFLMRRQASPINLEHVIDEVLSKVRG